MVKKHAPNLPQTLQSEDAAIAAVVAMERPSNLAFGLTPARLRRMLSDADSGAIAEQHALFADMEERCDHLFAEMSKRKRALLTLDWEIVPGRSGDKKAESVAAAVRRMVDAVPNLEDLIFDLSDAVGHGFSACEIEWRRLDGDHLPAAFHFRPQSWFHVAGNKLRLRDGSAQGTDLWPLGWIVHTHRSKSGWLPRYGLFRVLSWTCLIRAFALESNIQFAQIHGLPFRLGKYPPGSAPADIDALARALRYLGQDAAGVIPAGMEILFQTPAGGGADVAGGLVERCEKAISKAVLGGTLTSQADGRASTNALGNVHNEVRHDLLCADAKQIASTLTQGLIVPLARLNCGADDAQSLPWFRFDTQEPADLALFADALPKLAPIMRISKSWVHEKLKIPEAHDDADVLCPPAPAPLSVQPAAVLTASAPPLPLLQQAAERLTAPMLQACADGADPGDLRRRLADLYPSLDDAALTDLLAHAVFVADLWAEAQENRHD